ncbi:MAG: hypothetical protein ABEK36_01220 [Candidatus Aenigmatarchaeota archaeon]
MANRSLVQDAIGVMIAMVVIAAVAIPVATDALVTDVNTVTNETFNATSDPYTYTVSAASNNDFDEIDEGSLTCYSDAGSTVLADSACNITDSEAGTIKLSTTVDAGDEAVDYDWQPTGYIESALTRTVVDYIPVGLGLAVFIAAISLVAM